MTFPKEIAELVERFERNREAYRSGQYGLTVEEIKIVEGKENLDQ